MCTYLRENHSNSHTDTAPLILYTLYLQVGCTNMKRLIMYMTNSIPMYTVDWPWVDYTK